MPNYEDLTNQLESYIRSGDVTQAIESLDHLEISKIPNELRCRFAELSRRAGRSDFSIKILADQVHQRKKVLDPPGSEQIIEYCMALRELGAIDEAEMRLNQIDYQQNKTAVMCEIFMGFNRWDPAQVKRACLFYNDTFTEPDYQKAVVQVNLAAAHVALNELDAGRTLLAKLIVEFQLDQWIRLLCNCHELMAQIELKENNADRALAHLEMAEQAGLSAELKDHLYVDRWKAVIDAQKSGSIEPLQNLRAIAEKRGHYETIRAADFEIFKLNQDIKVLDKLYIGTPYPAYRKILHAEFPQFLAPGGPEQYLLNGNTQPLLNLETGQLGVKELAKSGSKPHLLLQVLFQDLYKPISIGGIFGKLFAGEVYDPDLSSKRVHQLIYRLRKDLKNHECPICIEKANLAYFCSVSDSISILLTGRSYETREALMLNKLREYTHKSSFSSSEAEKYLDLSQPSTHRLLRFGLDHDILSKQGLGAQTRYYFS